MKKMILSALLCATFAVGSYAQSSSHHATGTSWLKLGVDGAIPVGNIHDASSFALGGVLDAQWLANPHFGVGVASGYTHYFANGGGDGFGAIPLGLLLRYYQHASGFFIGGDVGYSFLTDVTGKDGGFYFKPEAGYHNYYFNFYAFYNHIVLGDNYSNVQSVGVGAIYNLHLKH